VKTTIGGVMSTPPPPPPPAPLDDEELTLDEALALTELTLEETLDDALEETLDDALEETLDDALEEVLTPDELTLTEELEASELVVDDALVVVAAWELLACVEEPVCRLDPPAPPPPPPVLSSSPPHAAVTASVNISGRCKRKRFAFIVGLHESAADERKRAPPRGDGMRSSPEHDVCHRSAPHFTVN
jgi:hypothetical protein